MSKFLRSIPFLFLTLLSACTSQAGAISETGEGADPTHQGITQTAYPPTPLPTGTPTAPATGQPLVSPTSTAMTPPTKTPRSTARPAHLLLPDAEVVYSPTALDFDTSTYLEKTHSFLSTYEQYLMITGWTPAAEVIERVALENSINPRLLLALLEYQSGCVFASPPAPEEFEAAMGANGQLRKDLYGQLVWAAHVLSEGFYGWREGSLEGVPFPDGSTFYPPEDTNPGTVALQYFFAQLSDREAWEKALNPQSGFPALYQEMFGDPWELAADWEELVPEELSQPSLSLPFEVGKTWAYTSGPHKAFENNGPRAALDFAPPMDEQGCIPTSEWVLAITHGLIIRSELGVVIQDVDEDGKEQTGWVILYLHISEEDRLPAGEYVHQGEKVGHPSCEGGIATGTHLHIARKYNGVWIPADGLIPFVLDGWQAHAGEGPRDGTLTRNGETKIANQAGAVSSQITREEDKPLYIPLGGE